ncbi:MAG: hypothetical protein KC731_28285, partial [Myxococcales bacterium]|nr:hypothetical protein [Myxococcales bacterium]
MKMVRYGNAVQFTSGPGIANALLFIALALLGVILVVVPILAGFFGVTTILGALLVGASLVVLSERRRLVVTPYEVRFEERGWKLWTKRTVRGPRGGATVTPWASPRVGRQRRRYEVHVHIGRERCVVHLADGADDAHRWAREIGQVLAMGSPSAQPFAPGS